MLSVIAVSTADSHPGHHLAVTSPTSPPTTSLAPTTTTPSTTAATAPSTTTTTAPGQRASAAPPPTAAPQPAIATLAGCPPPPHAPVPAPPPWHPSVLVPDSQLPPVTPPTAWKSDLAPLRGTGMWVWQWDKTSGGNAAAVVAQARVAHLHQLWVRVGDSMNGFYGAPELDQLVPAAHAAGLSVIAWGFPYLYDPVGDAHWSAQILAWRGPGGQTIDGYSADIERSSEGVDLTAQRAATYLQAVRRAAGPRLVVATVYPPTDEYWLQGGYPYSAMAPYVDAFAPMIYWECTDPGSDATFDVARLATLRPVSVIGQAFDMADVGGRAVAPSGAEINEFLQAGEKAGAVGASLWVWQDASPQEWAAVAAYRW
jgi:hypothetical protein